MLLARLYFDPDLDVQQQRYEENIRTPCHAVQSQRHNSIATVAAVVYTGISCQRASLGTYTGTPQTEIQSRDVDAGDEARRWASEAG